MQGRLVRMFPNRSDVQEDAIVHTNPASVYHTVDSPSIAESVIRMNINEVISVAVEVIDTHIIVFNEVYEGIT